MVRRAILVCVIGVGVALTGAHCASRTAPTAQPGVVEGENISVPDRGVPSRTVGRETVWEFDGFARGTRGNSGDEPLGRVLMPESAFVVTSTQRVTRLELTPSGGIRSVAIATSGRYPERELAPGVHRFKSITLDAEGYIVASVPANAGDDCVLEIDASTPPVYSYATKEGPNTCVLVFVSINGQLYATCECPVDP